MTTTTLHTIIDLATVLGADAAFYANAGRAARAPTALDSVETGSGPRPAGLTRAGQQEQEGR